MKYFFPVLLSLFFSLVSVAQNKYTINGYIRDSVTGESVIGASITVPSLSKTVSSNQYGFYSLTLEEGVYDLTVSHVSFYTQPLHIELKKNEKIDFLLLSKSAAMNEVVVYS
ncbi:MAG: carboxypeptidase-like regulatory domain-containing protein, partial [Flavisolibacter sp.]|nr:carboxypeptidase-like regulatory domain-containing protein [Flavisolibacter sp.]